MSTQSNSDELRVQEVDNEEIQRDLQARNIDISALLFETEQIEKAIGNGASANGTSESGTTKIERLDTIGAVAGNVVRLMDPIDQAISPNVSDLDEDEKNKIKARCKKSKEIAQKEKEGIGE